MERDVAPRVWSIQRKLLGNALPLICGAPFIAAGIWLWVRGLEWDAIGLAAAALFVSAVSLNWLGLAGNATMRRMLSARLEPGAGAIFVGFSRPGYVGVLDPHEDLGFLQIGAGSLQITGELGEFEIQRSPEIALSYAFNPHTLLGLGRWLVIDGKSSSKSVRILVEPRELKSLRLNRALSTTLRAQLDEWRRA